jgi:hypothetical protein
MKYSEAVLPAFKMYIYDTIQKYMPASAEHLL